MSLLLLIKLPTYSRNGLEYRSDVENVKKMIAELKQARALELKNDKWRGSVGGIVGAPIDEVWNIVSRSSRLSEWMPMVENCTTLAGEEGLPGYVRLVSGFMFPQDYGDRSWIKENLVSMNSVTYSYVYRMEASNVGLDGSINSLKLIDYGDDSTLIDWSFEIDPIVGASEDSLIDYLGFLYKSCIYRIEGAIRNASKDVDKA
ncbi:hypothetical protein IFM89_028042 [Coptis chinensis]|uniref:Uncharacterized protein n=1 Tax=Coptis chinensis TaxID=261450 RepID=A0A835LKR4_9MAGN|nr:hypothetical protein IFM89_028042 [Coptis chinensis]